MRIEREFIYPERAGQRAYVILAHRVEVEELFCA